VEHGEVRISAFLPADEDASKAIQPGVGALDDPTARAEAGLAFDRLRFVTAATNVNANAAASSRTSV